MMSPKLQGRRQTERMEQVRPLSFMQHDGQGLEDDFQAEDQDFDFIDEEVTRFATELAERDPMDETVKLAFSKKKKLTSDEQEDIVSAIQVQNENFKKVIEFASK